VQKPLDGGRHSQTSTVVDHVVGVGASAGGLEALQELSHTMTALGRVSYVVAQHLSPDHASLIVDLLSHSTTLSVVTATDGAPLQADVIAIAPPNHDLVVEGDHLRLSAPLPRFGPSPCIDLLFESIAEYWGDHGLAVVLSGTGADGARGMRAVRAAGGLTIAQSPESARFSAMPSAAISLGCADLILEASAIGPKIREWISHGGQWLDASLPAAPPAVLSSVMTQLKHATGIDFSQYKPSTLNRQIQRRMLTLQVSSLEDYLPLLSGDAGEARALVQNLLVTVTSFFRDPGAFAALREHLLVYVKQHSSNEQLRVWVPGCATGEEVFSLAMLLSEVLGHPAHLASHIKIFGTDLDEISLSVCRRGLYPISEAKAIPEELRARFVSEGDTQMEMTEELRSCTVFARHDVGEDPPFPRLDLVSCRNTLIYFTAPMQERVLNLFRFGLVPGGLLFLGGSESLANRTPGFKLINPEQRLFLRTSDGILRPRQSLALPGSRGPLAFAPAERMALVRDSVPEQHMALLESLIRLISKPSLVLDENHDLIEVIGDVTPFCRLPEGRIRAAATAFLLPELQSEARALFLLTRADGLAITSAPLTLEGHNTPMRLEVKPVQVGERRLWMLTFLAASKEPADAGAADQAGQRDQAFDREIERLEQELLSSQNTLRRSLSELEQANEELEASSEELQASSEELQSSNEELEASNEELQATNEELGTLNQQLRARSEELEQLNTDLENIQNCLSQGMVIVDRHLCILRFSPLSVRVFGLVQADLGHALLDVPTTLPLPGLQEALLAVIRGEPRLSLEASSEEVSYLLQILPYQECNGRRLGAIITLTDVSELVALRRAAEASLSEFSSLTDALEQAVLKWDPTMEHLLYASQRIQAITGWSSSELCDQPQLLQDAIDPADRERVGAARDLHQPGWSLRYRMTTREGRQRWVSETCTVVNDVDEAFIVGTLADVSDREKLEREARKVSAIVETVFHSESFAVAILDDHLRLVRTNDTFCLIIGHDQAAIHGVHADWLSAPGDPHSLSGLAEAALTGRVSSDGRAMLRLKLADGSLRELPAESRTNTDLSLGTMVTVIVSLGPRPEAVPIS
jgi:two-component system, chemotaxis family, CheB/CheR fusion protein